MAKIIASFMLLRLILEVVYVKYVANYFQYAGFYIDFAWDRYGLSWILFFSLLLVLKIKLRNILAWFNLYYVALHAVPILIIFGYDQERSSIPVILCALSFFIINLIASIAWPSVHLPYFSPAFKKFYIFVMSGFVLGSIYWLYLSGSQINFNFNRVYEFRSANSELANIGFLSYTNTWAYSVGTVLLLCYSLLRKRFVLAGCVVLLQLMFFAYTGHKGIILYVTLPIILFLGQRFFSKTYMCITVGAALIVLLSVSALFDDGWALSLLIRRALFVPADLTFAYMQFFGMNSNIYWSNSFLSGISQYPYADKVSMVIGAYIGNEKMSANNGYLSMGFAHAGLFGVFIYTFLVGILIRVVDFLVKNSWPGWAIGSMASFHLINIITSSDALVVLLTHGLGFLIISLVILRRRPMLVKEVF